MPAEASADVSRLADALRETTRESGITTYQVLIQSSSFILSEMEARVPVRSGNLRDSLGVRVHTDRVEIGPDVLKAPYAAYVEYGTAPHEIKPKTRNGVLVFTVGGKKVVTKLVHHPGTAAQPYVMPAFEAWVDSLGPMAAEANIKVFREAAA
jgi:Bacteriophage HK97-gp10, putative tail-component